MGTAHGLMGREFRSWNSIAGSTRQSEIWKKKFPAFSKLVMVMRTFRTDYNILPPEKTSASNGRGHVKG